MSSKLTQEEKELRAYFRRTRKPMSNFHSRRPVVIKSTGERFVIATHTIEGETTKRLSPR